MTTQQKSALTHTMLAILRGHGTLTMHQWYAYCQDLFRNDIVLFCELVKLLGEAGFIAPTFIYGRPVRFSLTDELDSEELVSKGAEEEPVSSAG